MRYKFTQRGTMLEPVTRSTTQEPNVFSFGVTLENKIPVWRTLVRTYSAFYQWSILQFGKSVANKLSCMSKCSGVINTLAIGRIENFTSQVDTYFKSAVSVAWNTIIIVVAIQINPHRQTVIGSRFFLGHTEIINLLFGASDFVAEHILKQLTKPGTTSKEIGIGNKSISGG